MNSSIELQKQIKDNAEDLRRFVSDLSNWEEEMKRKDSEARAASSKDNSAPIRNSSTKRDCGNTSEASTSGQSQGVKKRISSSDYAAWEKFDVEKACEEVEKPATNESSESEEGKLIREKRLRDESIVEKEKGNQFVKKEKWDNAIECYSRAIKCYSRDAIFYCNRALCFLKKKDYRAAETDCTSALALDNTYVKALHRRALARKELHQLEDAALDLKRANELEPNNSAIARDYNAVRLKLNEVAETIVTESIQAEAEVILDINVEKKTEPILPAKKHRPATNVLKEPKELSSKKQFSTFTAWPKLDDTVVVEPVNIPPHKRSKKPLQRVKIQENVDKAVAISSGEADLPLQSASGTFVNLGLEELRKDEGAKRKSESGIFNLGGGSKLSSHKLDHSASKSTLPSTSKLEISPSSLPKVIPPIPRNSVQFIAGWRQISRDSNLCYQYLKQINGADFPKIFQDSLDGNILSQILEVLSTQFVTANEPVLTYLQGLTQVKRFRTLSLFLSQTDKDSLDTLFKHTLTLEKTSSDLIASLKMEYEL